MIGVNIEVIVKITVADKVEMSLVGSGADETVNNTFEDLLVGFSCRKVNC